MTNNPTQVEPVEGLADKILWHVEQVCGPLSRDALVVPGDDDHSVLRANILSIIRSSTVNDELVEALREMVESCGITPSIHDGCGTTIITAPSAVTFAKACSALAKLETPDA